MSFLGLFGSPSVEKLKNKGNVEGLIKALGFEKDASIRQAAAQALGEIDDAQSVEPLISTLKDSDIKVRQFAASALGQIGDPRAVEPLITVLEDKDVRKSAAGALVDIGVPAVEPLIANLQHEDPHVCKVVAEILVQIGDPRGVGPIIAAFKDVVKPLLLTIQDESQKWRAHREAAKELIKIGAPAVEILITNLKDADEDVRLTAAKALNRMDGESKITLRGLTVEPLIVALKDTDKDIRLNAIGALRWVSREEGNDALRIQIVEPLLAAINDTDKDVRSSAIRLLGHVGKRLKDDTLRAQIVESLLALDPDTNEDAALALGDTGDPRAVKSLVRIVQNDKIFGLKRNNAAGLLGQFFEAQAVEPLINALLDKEEFNPYNVSNSLRAITGQDFGSDHSQWLRWWKAEKDVFLSLTHEERILLVAQKLLKKRSQILADIDKTSERIRRAEASIEHWEKASDFESSRMGVGYGKEALESARKDKQVLNRQLASLNTTLQQLNHRLEDLISRSSHESFIVRAREIQKGLVDQV